MLAVGGDGGRCSMQRLLRNYFTMLTTVGGVARPELRPEAWLQKENGKLARTRCANLDSWVARTAALSQEGWHFSCERGCTRDDYGKAGPFSVERLNNGPTFCECFVCTNKYTAKRRPSWWADLCCLRAECLRRCGLGTGGCCWSKSGGSCRRSGRRSVAPWLASPPPSSRG